jgi:hypothetical protein
MRAEIPVNNDFNSSPLHRSYNERGDVQASRGEENAKIGAQVRGKYFMCLTLRRGVHFINVESGFLRRRFIYFNYKSVREVKGALSNSYTF